MQTRLGRFESRGQLFIVLLRSEQLLTQRNILTSQGLTQLSNLANFGFEGIEFSMHGGTIGGVLRRVNQMIV